jgi:hypothetical protein
MIRVDTRPELLRLARERAGFSVAMLARRFPKLEAWEHSEARPMPKQLETFAKATYTPVGFLFPPEPPVEQMPIPDLCTVDNVHVGHRSPGLLDTVCVCQQRQEWYGYFARSMGQERLAFVGSERPTEDAEATAARIRCELGFDLEERRGDLDRRPAPLHRAGRRARDPRHVQ